KNGLTHDTDYAVLEDKEGSIWVASQVGLDRFRKGDFGRVDLPGPSFRYGLAAGDKGDVWVFGRASPTIGHAVPSEASTVGVEGSAPQACAGDPAGGIGCLGYYGGVRLEQGRVSHFALPEEILKPYADKPRKAYLGMVRVAFDRSGTLWASFQDHGVYRFE